MPFQPGVSGNPSGRPKKGWSFTDLIRSVGEEVIDLDGKLTRKEKLIRKAYQAAEKGNLTAIEWLVDRVEGRPNQSVNVKQTNVLQDHSDEELEEFLVNRQPEPGTDSSGQGTTAAA